jgi:hypothetical protein
MMATDSSSQLLNLAVNIFQEQQKAIIFNLERMCELVHNLHLSEASKKRIDVLIAQAAETLSQINLVTSTDGGDKSLEEMKSDLFG